jgi:antitoxin YefM
MAHVSYTELRGNLAKFMNEVCDSKDALVVTRQGARSVVLLSEDEYNGMIETLHLLRSPANAERVLSSIRESDEGNMSEHDVIEGSARVGV